MKRRYMLFTLIILFGFCIDVKAKQITDFKEYYFYTSKESGGDTLIHGGDGMTGSLEQGGNITYFDGDKKAYFYVDTWDVMQYMKQADINKLQADNLIDSGEVLWDKITDSKMKERIIYSYLSNRFHGTANGGDGVNNAFKFLKETYCKKSPGKSTVLCTKFVPAADGTSFAVNGREACSFSIQSGLINEDKDRVTQTFWISFIENDDGSLSDPKVHNGKNFDESVDEDYFSLVSSKGSGFRLYTHEIGETKEAFLQNVLNNIKSPNGGYRCDGNLLSMCLSKDNNTDLYLLVKKDECDTSKYASWYRQQIGDDVSGDIEFSDEEDTTRRRDLLGKVIDILSCKDLFEGTGENGSMLLDILKVLVSVVKIGVPALLLIMGSIDFIKAIFAQDEEGIKKAQSKFVRRLIVAIIIFLIPTVLKALLWIAHGIWPEIVKEVDEVFCGII